MPRRYKPVKSARLFTKKIGYDQINWRDWDDVIKRFKEQLYWWYVSPMKHIRRKPHSGFTVVALGCILIDTLSQYIAGLEESDGNEFKRFVRTRLPSSGGAFASTIRVWRGNSPKPDATDFADVLWSGFRCGILHEAHVPLYGRLWGVAGMFDFHASGFATYDDNGAPCPTVNLNPGPFSNEVIAAFDTYIAELKTGNVTLRNNFRKKFLVSYGIDVGNEPP